MNKMLRRNSQHRYSRRTIIPCTYNILYSPNGQTSSNHYRARVSIFLFLFATLALSLTIRIYKNIEFATFKDFQSSENSFYGDRNVSQEAELTICLITSDFRGLPFAGGTATAFELLAKALQKERKFRVVFVAAPLPSHWRYRANALKLHQSSSFKFVFLGKEWQPWKMVDTYPWERAGMAVMNWLLADEEGCSIVHIHEWGGLAAPLGVFHRFAGFRQGISIVVQEHGGHRWSTQLVIRNEDAIHLRIDAAERTAVELADAVTAPSAHMLDWYADRGWIYPNIAEVLPNVLDTTLNEPQGPTEHPIWQLIFFGRLETRKGLVGHFLSFVVFLRYSILLKLCRKWLFTLHSSINYIELAFISLRVVSLDELGCVTVRWLVLL